jgi:cytochrome c peroxidase
LAADEVSLTPQQLLGKRLFTDANLSVPAGQSCASCHDEKQAFQGNNGSRLAPVALGSRPETFGDRNVPTAMYLAHAPVFSFELGSDEEGKPEYTPTGGLFWDGRAKDLAEQAKGPFLNPREMNNPDKAAVVAKVRTSAYAQLFRSVFGQNALDDVEAAYDKIGTAIAAFEATPRFQPFTSKFDDVLRGKDQFTAAEARGFELFKNPEKGNCLACHVGDEKSTDPADWPFTDFTYDNVGVPRNKQIPDNDDPAHFDLGLAKQDGIAAKAPAGFDVNTLAGAFKVPTLRNIDRSGPYMHNGFFKELRDVVSFYVTRETNPELWYSKDASGQVQKYDDLPAEYHGNVNITEVPYDRKAGEQPRLNDTEIDDVVAFMKTLTDR